MSYIILGLFYIIQFPFSAAGYLAHWITAFWYFGWSKSAKHQDYLIKLSDERKAK